MSSRRQFLAATVGGLVAVNRTGQSSDHLSMSAKITSVEAFPINYRVAGHFKFFEAPPGRPQGRPAVVVKIVTEDGAVGWGQSVPTHRWSYETLESVYSTIRNYLGPSLIGVDALDSEAIQSLLQRTTLFSTGQPICKCIDLALWDLKGRLSAHFASNGAAKTGKNHTELDAQRARR
jgi:muconate cycloisomerase